jgi:DNA-binding transcriptional ArsR family regulator
MFSRYNSPPSPDELAAAEAVFCALAHASRRHILLVLHFRGGRMTAGEIADRFACSWPTTSRHLRVLEDAGLVTITKVGRERIYQLERERLLDITGDWLRWFRDAAPASTG